MANPIFKKVIPPPLTHKESSSKTIFSTTCGHHLFIFLLTGKFNQLIDLDLFN